MCFPQKKGDKVCACCCSGTSNAETMCDCNDMKKSFEERLSALEKKLE